MPRSLGGTHVRGNLQGLCRECHEEKTATENAKGRPRQFCNHGFPIGLAGWDCGQCAAGDFQ